MWSQQTSSGGIRKEQKFTPRLATKQIRVRSVMIPSLFGSIDGSPTYTIRSRYMNFYWEVIRIRYVSIICEGVNIRKQHFYEYGNGIVYRLIEFHLIFEKSRDVLFLFEGYYARRLRRYTATLPFFVKGPSHGQSSFFFLMRSNPWWLFHIEITNLEIWRGNNRMNWVVSYFRGYVCC